MSTGSLTLFDVVSRNNSDVISGLVEDVTIFTPEFSEIPVQTRPGITYKVSLRTGLPTATFRVPNTGAPAGRSVFKQAVKEMFFIDTPLVIDQQVYEADDGSIGDLLAAEAQGAIQGSAIAVAQSTYYGGDSISTGFQGLRAQVSGSVGAGGTTNSTTAYLLSSDKSGVTYDVGKNGVVNLRPWGQQLVVDPNTAGNYYNAWVSNLSYYIGLSVKSAFGVWCATGITTHITSSAYDQALTDKLAQALYAKVPIQRRNSLKWFMNRTSEFLLQQSRTAINYQPAGASGAPAVAPAPQTLCGRPIVVTEAITDTENNS